MLMLQLLCRCKPSRSLSFGEKGGKQPLPKARQAMPAVNAQMCTILLCSSYNHCTSRSELRRGSGRTSDAVHHMPFHVRKWSTLQKLT